MTDSLKLIKTDDVRAIAVATRAIGCQVRLHIAEHTYIKGRVVECAFVRWQHRDTMNKYAVFSLTIASGAKGAFKYKYTVLEVPNPDADSLGEVKVLEFKEPGVDRHFA